MGLHGFKSSERYVSFDGSRNRDVDPTHLRELFGLKREGRPTDAWQGCTIPKQGERLSIDHATMCVSQGHNKVSRLPLTGTLF